MSRESKIILLVTALVVAGVALLITVVNSNQADPATIMEKIVKTDSQKVGTGNVQVVEFGDFQCPACAQAHPDVKRLKEEFASDITFVFRHFPLASIHPNAQLAAEAAEAAAAQGKFWEMHDKIFETQTQWGLLGDPTTIFVQYAGELELDTDRFSKELMDRTYKDKVSADQSDGYSVGVTGTPTFFINGKQQSRFDYDSLKSAIETELQK